MKSSSSCNYTFDVLGEYRSTVQICGDLCKSSKSYVNLEEIEECLCHTVIYQPKIDGRKYHGSFKGAL